MARKTVSFVAEEATYNQLKEIFPEAVGRPENLKLLVDAFLNPKQNVEEVVENTINSNLIGSIAAIYQCEPSEISNYIQLDKNEIEVLKAQKTELLSDVNYLKETIRDLNNSIDTPVNWEQIRKTINPLPLILLELTAERLSEKLLKTVTPMQILVDMFLRYTVERQSNWFYPFVLNDREILSLAREINPEIVSIDNLKSLWK